MALSKKILSLGFLTCVACTPTSGAWGPQGYEQSLTKYRVNFADASQKQFLPNDWRLDNYTYDSLSKKWREKDGNQYRAERRLDEDGDGTIGSNEKRTENIYDLRFVNSRDNAVIWLKVHPMEATQANLDLDVLLENYADGLAGTGLFEQSSLFGLAVDKVRHYTSFIVKKEPTALGNLSAIRGVIEIADVDKLRLDPKHRDSKAELVFAKVVYLEDLGFTKPNASRWPVVAVTSGSNGQYVHYKAQRTGLLVIGYYDDASRFESHLKDLHALLDQIVIPESAIPPNAEPPLRTASAAPAESASRPVAPATSTASPEPAASATPPAVSGPAPAKAPATAASSAASAGASASITTTPASASSATDAAKAKSEAPAAAKVVTPKTGPENLAPVPPATTK